MRNRQAHCQEHRENPEVQSPSWGTPEKKADQRGPSSTTARSPATVATRDRCRQQPPSSPFTSRSLNGHVGSPKSHHWFTAGTRPNQLSWPITIEAHESWHHFFYFVSISFFSNYLNTIMNDVSVLFFGNTLWCVWTFLTYFSTSMETLSFNFKVLFFLF